MKKIYLSLFSLLLINFLTAQNGTYNGGNGQGTYSSDQGYNQGNYDYNGSQYNGQHNNNHDYAGTAVAGNVTTYHNAGHQGHYNQHAHHAPERRVIKRWAHSGRFFWRITQERRWHPAHWGSQHHGHGNWIPAGWVWETVSRVRVPVSGHCGWH